MKLTKLQKINQTLAPIYLYSLVFFSYIMLGETLTVWLPSRLDLFIYELLIFIFPIFLVFETVRRKREFLNKTYCGITFLLTMIPGAIAGAIFGYGWYGMTHDKDFLGNVGFGLLFFGILSGLLGIFTEYTIMKNERRKK